MPDVKAPTDEELREALAGLWTRAYGELELQVRYTLTEPTCPMAIITTESGDGPYFRADRDTIAEAVRHVMLAAYVTLILRQPQPQTVPWSEPTHEGRVENFLATLDTEHACKGEH